MAEENQVQAQADGGQAQEVNTELQKARSGNKILKIVAVVLAVLFLVMAGAAFYIYRKIAQTKNALEEVFNSSPSPFQQAGQSGDMPREGFAMFGGGGGQSSGLGLITGSPGGQSQFTAENGERVHAAMMKYAERPIVKEFIADLKKNPDMAKAFEQSKGNNPLVVISSIRNAKGMEAVVAKYAYRPEFLSLLMEVMKDPEIKPLLGGMPGMGGALSQAPVPPSAPAPAESPEPSLGSGDSPMVLDTSVISGTPSEPAARPRGSKAPPPVDSN
jgi:preprotein translocase subunit SecG